MENDLLHMLPRFQKVLRRVMKVPPTRGSLILALNAISETSLVNIVVWWRTNTKVSRM